MNRQSPPEIIQLIVKASLDPVNTAHRVSCFTRYSTLKNYSLLNSTWREVCKPSLYKIVMIWSEGAALDFVRVAAGQGGAIGGVEMMNIDCYCWSNTRPTALLGCVLQLRSLTLSNAAFHAEDLTNSHRLQNLTLDYCTVLPPSPSTHLHIRHLHIDSSTSSTSFTALRALLTPAVLPNLREVDLNDAHLYNLTALIPQLSALQLDSGPIVRYLPLATSLRLLSLDAVACGQVLRSLTPLTPLPPFLLLRNTHTHNSLRLVHVLDYLIANPTRGLTRIFADCQRVKDPSHDGKLNWLIVALGSKGIVVEIGRFTFSEAIRRMDAILLAAKEAAEKREWDGLRR